MRASRCLWPLTVSLLAASAASAVSAAPLDAVHELDASLAEPDLGFDVSAEILARQILDMAPSDDGQQLRVRSIGGDVATCGAAAPASSSGDRDGHGDGRRRAPVRPQPPTPEVSDRLVSVDGTPVSLQPLEHVLGSPVGSAVLLPLFKEARAANVLAGFARVEIVGPTALRFEPTTPARRRHVRDWLAAGAAYDEAARLWALELAQNRELREAVAREQQAAEARAREFQARLEAHERAEAERVRMTPHEAVAGKRRDGWEFRFAAEFAEPGPVGIGWDLLETDKAVVSHLEPELPAHELAVIAPGDQLIALNGVDTAAMDVPAMAALFQRSPLPRTLVFLVRGKRSVPPQADAPPPPPPRPQNWTLAFDSPAILRGWRVRLHLANWSALPEPPPPQGELELEFELAEPVSACPSAQDARRPGGTTGVETRDVAFLAYRGACALIDKVAHVRAAGGRALLVANNVHGDGRFAPAAVEPDPVDLPVMLMSKLDGDVVVSVMEHERATMRIREEPRGFALAAETDLPRWTRPEDASEARRTLLLWSPGLVKLAPDASALERLAALPARVGTKIPSMPFRVVAAYPQETACDLKGLRVLATRAAVLVQRGECSIVAKIKVVQSAGGAGILFVSADDALPVITSDAKDAQSAEIWVAAVGRSTGTRIQQLLETSKGLPALVRFSGAYDGDAAPK